MKFSLVLTTKGRTDELERCLQSLTEQTNQDFEIILSDQNEDDRVSNLLTRWDWGNRLLHLKSSGGISRGRNKGLDHAKGDIVGFPDDDCCFPPRLLEEVANFFDAHLEYGFISGRSVADDGKDSVGRHSEQAGVIERDTIYSQCIEFAIFIRRSRLAEMRFDENMGVGSSTPWQADEGPDLILRMKKKGIQGYYDPRFAVWHPRPTQNYDRKTLDRSYRYACGSGYFLRKHNYPFGYLLYYTLRTSCGFILACLTLNTWRARFYLARIRGQWRGWTGYKSKGPLGSPDESEKDALEP